MVTSVLPDTNVLFPFSVMDVLLALSEDRVHRVLWTEALLAEWEDVIVREQRRSAETAASITAAIREFFADDEVTRDEYAPLVARMPGKDPDDHQHMAAAAARQPCVLLTHNRQDFPARPLAEFGVQVTDPDGYLSELADELGEDVAATVVRLAAEKRRPPKTPDDLLNDLAHAGAVTFASKVRQILASQEA